MTDRRPALEALGWLDVLAAAPFVSGDSRFLRRYFLPAHGRYRFRDYSEALAGLRGARSAADLAARGRLRRILGDDSGARRDLAAALKRDPRRAEAWAFRGELSSVEHPAAALRDLSRALRLYPSHRPALLWKAYASACLGRIMEALAELDALLAGGPSTAGFLLRGLLRERRDDLEGAEADYSAAIAADSFSPGLFTLRAAARCKRGDLAGAVADADRGLLLHPENLDGYVRILYLTEGLKTAIDPAAEKEILLRSADRLLAEDPRRAWAHAARAGVLGRSDLQIEGLRRAVALAPDNGWMRAFLGRALGGGDAASRAEGLREMTEAARLAPRAGWILCWRAELRRQLEDFEGARADLDAGLSLDPDYRLGFAWRAFLRDARGDSAGGVCDMTVCLEAMPRTAFFHLRGEMRRRAGDPAGALRDAVLCMAQSPLHALAYSGAGWMALMGRPGTGRPVPKLMRARRELRGRRSGLEEASLIRFMDAAGCVERFPLKLIEVPSGGKAGLLWAARAELDAGREGSSLTLLGRALRREPASFLARAWRGEALCRLGRPGAALADLDRALGLKPSFLPALLWRAAALSDLGRRAEALAAVLAAQEAGSAGGLPLVRLWLKWRRPELTRRRAKDGAAARSSLAELALRAGRPARACRLLGTFPGGKLPPRGLLVRGLARACVGDWRGARSDLARAAGKRAEETSRFLPVLLKAVPGLENAASALAYLALARAEESLGRAGEARRLLSIAGRLSSGTAPFPGFGEAALKKVERKLESLGFDGMLANFKSVISIEEAQERSYGPLLMLLERLSLRHADSWLVHALRGKVLSNLSRYPEAEASLKRSLELDGGRSRSRGWFAGLLLLEGRFQEAVEDCGKAVSLDPGNAWAYFYRAAGSFALGRLDAARADLRRLALVPRAAQARLAGQVFSALMEAKAGNGGKAVGLIGRALEGHPRGTWIRALRANLEASRGDYDAALRDIESVLRGGGKSLPGRDFSLSQALELSPKLLAAGRSREQIRVLRGVIAARPAWFDARIELARALMRQGAFEEAGKILDGRRGGAKRDGRIALLRARLWEAKGNWRRAAQSYELSCAEQPRLETYFYWAQNLQRQDKTGEMFSVLRAARRACRPASKDDVGGRLERFRLAMCLCDYGEAFRLAEEVLDKTRSLVHLEVLRWPSFIEEFDLGYGCVEYLRGAVRALGRRIAVSPAQPWGYYYRSILLKCLAEKTGREPGPRIKEDHRRIKALAGERYRWMRMETAKQFLYEGNLERALEEFKPVVGSCDPGNWVAQCQIGEILLCLGRPREAEKAFESAEVFAPEIDRGCVLAWKGEFYLWRGLYSRALRCLEEAARRPAQYVHCWRGGALVRLGRHEEALPVLERAMAVSPEDIEARIWRGEALYRLGRYREALKHLDSLLARLGDSNFYAHVLRGLVHGRLGDPRAMRRDFKALPSDVAAHMGVGKKELSEAGMERVLERILVLSKGVRRGGYERMVWMGRGGTGAGARH
jgi:tetratricopeptide (TPR) repeat protein